ncbi:hypothetical protein D9757_002196 [Collybiopsis confluens]|uniref:Uncharacterized protein n=1 Tax=Collybiopsis confluens TaxID=2823264 RepID=A0A8H5HZY8_9AGAR|nr:hypothetical protein D9757_002196 [Collybiopsis confluens]
MSDTSGSLRVKPNTRSAIRQSLNFASVGKAFADVMNKERSDSARKAGKDTPKSGVALKPRGSLDSKPSPSPAKRSRTPDSKTITSRRRSSLATTSLSGRNSAEGPAAVPSKVPPAQTSASTRSSTLRPRPGSSSNLPKYRPKSITSEKEKKSDSPNLSHSKKRTSAAGDEDKISSGDMAADPPIGPAVKTSRPISPLPHRATLKTNVGIADTKTNSSKLSTPSRASPSRVVKAVKTAGSIPRPSSSSSSSSSFSPRTPRASPDRGKRDAHSAKVKNTVVSDSSEASSHSGLSDSPLVRHVRQRSKVETTPVRNTANMSHISEADSDDEEEDVGILLAPVAAPGAPTPAMPRLQPLRHRSRLMPTTPTKPPLPILFEPPEAASTPPKNQESPSFLRPNPSPGSDRSIRGGSILSWEQLATEASRTIPVDELGTMLSDMSAPFQPLSPMPTGNGSMLLDVNTPANIPSSPALSAFNSPSGYGSISHVLLPNVTPSPALARHPHSHRQQNDSESEVRAVDTAITTLLRLQLSSAENMAKERLVRLQELEEELHNLKEARVRDADVLSQQVSILEAQLQSSLESRERSEGEQYVYTASLEDQLRQAQDVERARKFSEASWKSALETQEMQMSASMAAQEWRNVKAQFEAELDVMKSDKATLELLLGELDLARRRLAK